MNEGKRTGLISYQAW